MVLWYGSVPDRGGGGAERCSPLCASEDQSPRWSLVWCEFRHAAVWYAAAGSLKKPAPFPARRAQEHRNASGVQPADGGVCRDKEGRPLGRGADTRAAAGRKEASGDQSRQRLAVTVVAEPEAVTVEIGRR